MNNRALTMSLVLAVLAVFFVESYVASIEEETKKKFGSEILVLSAKKDIAEMETVTEAVLELKRIPKRFLEPAAISFRGSEEDSAQEIRQLVGNVAIVPIRKGEQITFNKLQEPGLRTGLSPQITPGKRAVSVPVTEVTSVGKLVKPGDRVDVLVSLDTGSGKANVVTKVLLQDVVVLAVGRNVTNNVPRVVENDGNRTKVRSLTTFDGFASVTLEVDPGQAVTVASIVSNPNNTIVLALRNNDDQERAAYSGVSAYDILGSDAARIRAPAGRGGSP